MRVLRGNHFGNSSCAEENDWTKRQQTCHRCNPLHKNMQKPLLETVRHTYLSCLRPTNHAI